MYHPNLGRWITEDPILLEGGDPNYYRFVGNNPTNLTDSSGLAADLFVPGNLHDGVMRSANYFYNLVALADLFEISPNAGEFALGLLNKIDEYLAQKAQLAVTLLAKNCCVTYTLKLKNVKINNLVLPKDIDDYNPLLNPSIIMIKKIGNRAIDFLLDDNRKLNTHRFYAGKCDKGKSCDFDNANCTSVSDTWDTTIEDTIRVPAGMILPLEYSFNPGGVRARFPNGLSVRVKVSLSIEYELTQCVSNCK